MKTEMLSQAATAAQSPITTHRIRLPRFAMRDVYRRAWSRSSVAMLAVLVLLTAFEGVATAQSRPLDLFRGPVVSSGRIIGLGGAFTGVGDGIDAAFKNKAALANRSPRSIDWFDYDLTLDWMITPGGSLDFDADGRVAGDDVSFNAINFGLSVLFDALAIGTLVQVLSYDADDAATGRRSEASFIDALLGAAYAFDDGQWIAALGFNVRALEFRERLPETFDGGANYSGGSFDFGLLWRPRAYDFRIGAQVRLGAELGLDEVDGDVPEARRPRSAQAPWEVAVGASWLWAADPERVYNAPHRSGDGRPSDELESDLRYLLVALDVVVSGATDGANLEGFIGGEARPAGGAETVGVHLGVEGEIVSNLLRARLGTYLEPGRVDAAGFGRVHGTGGVEVRLFRLWIWQIKASFGFDVADGYQNVLFGVGFWN